MNDARKNQILKIAVPIIMGIIVLATILFVNNKGFVNSKNPFKDEDKIQEDEYGDIIIDEEDDFKGEKDEDLDKGQVIDANKITYLRETIHPLGISLLVPQKWEITMTDTNDTVYFNPPENEDYSKVQVALYYKNSKDRKTNSLLTEFDSYKNNGFVYKNQGYKLIPQNYTNGDYNILYDTKTKVFVHKNRDDKFEQFYTIPTGLDPENFEEKDKFVGIMENKELSMKDKNEHTITGRTYNKFFHTFARNNKSILISFTAPKNYTLEMDEIARVMSLSVRHEEVLPANKSDAETINDEKELSFYKFKTSDNFEQVVYNQDTYQAKTYDTIFDKSYGIDIDITNYHMDDSFIFENFMNEPIQEQLKKDLINKIYLDTYEFSQEQAYELFNFKTISQEDKVIDGKDAVEYVLQIDPKEDELYDDFDKLDAKLPIKMIVTLVPSRDNYLVSIVTYNDSNYELAEVYNNAITKSLKEIR